MTSDPSPAVPALGIGDRVRYVKTYGVEGGTAIVTQVISDDGFVWLAYDEDTSQPLVLWADEVLEVLP